MLYPFPPNPHWVLLQSQQDLELRKFRILLGSPLMGSTLYRCSQKPGTSTQPDPVARSRAMPAAREQHLHTWGAASQATQGHGHPQTAAGQFRLFPRYFYYFKQVALLLPLPFAPFPLQFPQHCPASLSPHRLLPLPRTEARQRKTQHQAGPPPRYLVHSKNTSHQLGTASLDNSPSKKCPDPSPGAFYHTAPPLPSP